MKIDQIITNAEGRREGASHSNESSPAPRNTRFTSPAPLAEQMPGVHHIELNLHNMDQLFNTMDPSPFHEKEGLTIAGWVAMWRPLEIYLYEWWPLRRRGQIFDKLSRMAVEVRQRA